MHDPHARLATWRQTLRTAFPATVPVLIGFLTLGAAYGVLMADKGYGFPWPSLMSAAAFCGSMQYVAITLLAGTFNPVYAFLLALLVNARHLFYGLSLLERYRGLGRLRALLVFMLCDETFSIVCGAPPPAHVRPARYYACVSVLNYAYWQLGTLAGTLLGPLVRFDTDGLDFALTALFVVIFVEQWRGARGHRAALTGIGCALAALVLLGPGTFLPLAMALILAALPLMDALSKRRAQRFAGGEPPCE